MLLRCFLTSLALVLAFSLGCSGQSLGDSLEMNSVTNSVQGVAPTEDTSAEVTRIQSSNDTQKSGTSSFPRESVTSLPREKQAQPPQIGTTPGPTEAPTLAPTPEPASDPAALVQISVGEDHVCGIRLDQKLACWRRNDHGQADPPSGEFTEVSSGRYHSCAINISQVVECWGGNSYAAASPPTDTFLQLDGYHDTYCGVQTNFAINCWGQQEYSEASWPAGRYKDLAISGSSRGCAINSVDKTVCWYGETSYTLEVLYQAISVAENGWSCGISEDGALRCWVIREAQEELLKLYGEFQSLSAGADEVACGVTIQGRLHCIADKYDLVPDEVGHLRVKAVDASYGDRVICAITETGSPICWTWDSDLNIYYLRGTKAP